MSEPALELRRAKSHVVTDADLRRLGVRGLPLRLVLYAREKAGHRGTLTPVLPNWEAAERLGVSPRSVQRAKKRLEAVGILRRPGERRTRRYTGSEGGNLADVYFLDRRQLEQLRPLRLVATEESGWGDSSGTPLKEVKPPSHPRSEVAGGEMVGRAHARDRPPPAEAGFTSSVPNRAAPVDVEPGVSVPVAPPRADIELGSPVSRGAGVGGSPQPRRRSRPERAALDGARREPVGAIEQWLAHVGPHYAHDRRVFHEELGRCFGIRGADAERLRQELLSGP